jgi:hypothetical protein
MPKSEKELFASTQKKIHIKVFSVITHWITIHLYNLDAYREVEDDMKYFINKISEQQLQELEKGSMKQVIGNLERKLKELEAANFRTLEFYIGIQKANVNGLTYKKFQKFSFFGFTIDEIAKQIVIIDHENFKQVKPPELLNKNWESKDAEKLAPNILKITKRSQQVINNNL